MKDEEIKLISSRPNAVITAPAGHGKTEMITDLVDRLPGKKLILTHTNAGVSALSARLKRKQVDRSRFSLSTISSFCMRWCDAYPNIAGVDPEIKVVDKGYYEDRAKGTAEIFTHEWARHILKYTYGCVIVDEYQDCVVGQHKIFLNINKSIPVYVLGDPLQTIFGWAGRPVSWSNIGFEKVPVETYPWRWEKGNKELGQYLTNIRDVLLPSLDGKRVKMPIEPVGDYIKIIPVADAREFSFVKELSQYDSSLFITKWKNGQCSFAQHSDGIFQNDEPQNLDILYTYADLLDNDDGQSRTQTIYAFLLNCATHISTELGSYGDHIREENYDFSRISKYPEFGSRILSLYEKHGYYEMLSVLEWIRENSKFRIYRRELFNELCRSIRFARDHGITVKEAAQQIRMNPANQSKYSNFKRISSRTVLSKGLEFDCVAIDCTEKYSATDMYVAMTRAMKVIYFITDNNFIWLDPPAGLLSTSS